MVEINKIGKISKINIVLLFVKWCQKIYYACTYWFRNDHNKVDWLSIFKTKPRSRFHVVHDSNDEVTRGEDVFQLDEWVDPYWVAASTELEEDLIFHVVDKSNVHVDIN